MRIFRSEKLTWKLKHYCSITICWILLFDRSAVYCEKKEEEKLGRFHHFLSNELTVTSWTMQFCALSAVWQLMKYSTLNLAKQFALIALDAQDVVHAGTDIAMVNLERRPSENRDYRRPAHSVLSSSMTSVVKFSIQDRAALPVHGCYVFDSERRGTLQGSHVDRTVCHNTPANNKIRGVPIGTFKE